MSQQPYYETMYSPFDRTWAGGEVEGHVKVPDLVTEVRREVLDTQMRWQGAVCYTIASTAKASTCS